MILAPPPDIAYDDELKGWLHRLSVAANKDAAVLTIDTANTRIGISDSTPTDAVDVGTGHVRSNGWRCQAGEGGAYMEAHTFSIDYLGDYDVRVWINNANMGNISWVSDERLKKNVKTLAVNALDRINQLRVVTFSYKDADGLVSNDTKTREGFIAHEVQQVIPDAVIGEKDATDAKGRMVAQSFRVLPLLGTLTKGIQELHALVQEQAALIVDLQKRVEQLEKKQP